MIYSASRRTDLPAFYPDYIVSKVSRSRKLEGIVFWTKDIRNFVRHLGLSAVLTSYPAIIQYTVTGLAGSVWEPEVPSFQVQYDALSEVASLLPPGAVRWRFDPILQTDDDLYERFEKILVMFRAAGIFPDSVVVSFPDYYRKVRERLQNNGLAFTEFSFAEKLAVLEKLHSVGGIKIQLCCEDELLAVKHDYLEKGCCVSAGQFKELYGIDVDSRRDAGQRAQCGCTRSTDIGSYDQKCGHNCVYCYAR